MKKALLFMALMTAAVLLAGCAANESYPEAQSVSVQQADPMTVPTDAPAQPDTSLPEGYDPASEEDNGSDYISGAAYDDLGRQIYAGATPIPLDPVDMPTATPRPPLTFTYGDATANNLKLSFQAPVGWGMDDSSTDTLILQDPNTYDNVNATMTVKITSVPSTYTLADVKTEVRNMLKEIGQYNFAEWSPTELAERTLLKKDGYYANYRGVYYDGTIVRGRVMVALLDGHRIITLHMSCPAGYNEAYMGVVAHFRDTLKQIQ